MNEGKYLYEDLTYKIIGAAMEVHSELGYGYLEKVYENSLMVLFRKKNINADQQKPITVHFKNEVVGEYFADILVENKIILELKSVEKLNNAHIAQTLNYLKATGMRLALLINFGKEKLEHKRLVF